MNYASSQGSFQASRGTSSIELLVYMLTLSLCIAAASISASTLRADSLSHSCAQVMRLLELSRVWALIHESTTTVRSTPMALEAYGIEHVRLPLPGITVAIRSGLVTGTEVQFYPNLRASPATIFLRRSSTTLTTSRCEISVSLRGRIQRRLA